MDFIDSLRKKPLAVRKRIAFIASAILTLVIFALWATIWNFNFSKKTPNGAALLGASATATSSESVLNPFGVLSEVFSQGWNGLMNNFKQIDNGIKNVQNTVQTISNTASSTGASDTSKSNSDTTKITQ